MVAAKRGPALETYILRAERMLEGTYAPWRVPAEGAEAALRDADMRLAVCIVAERIALAAPASAAAAMGVTSQNAGRSSFSRAPGGGNIGEGVAGELVPDEAAKLLARWSLAGDGSDDFRVVRTTVFAEALVGDFGDGEKVLADEDFWGPPVVQAEWPGAQP